jgi:hypothetical protein
VPATALRYASGCDLLTVGTFTFEDNGPGEFLASRGQPACHEPERPFPDSDTVCLRDYA